MQTLESQVNVRLNPACVELIKLERRTLPGCHSDGEALESIIFRSAVSEEARQIIRRAAAREAAKTRSSSPPDLARKPKSVRPPTNTQQDPNAFPWPATRRSGGRFGASLCGGTRKNDQSSANRRSRGQ